MRQSSFVLNGKNPATSPDSLESNAKYSAFHVPIINMPETRAKREKRV